MSDEAKTSIRNSIRGADRGLRVIDGGGAPKPPADPPRRDGDCPVVALGHLDGVFHVLDVRGQKRGVSARQLGSRHELLALFGGDEAWLRAEHPRKVKTDETDGAGNPVFRTVDFHVNAAAAALQRACFAAGLFGDHIKLRPPGIWLGADGSAVVHCGDAVLLGDAWHDPGVRTAHQVWVAAAPTARPGVPCPAQVARDLQDGLVRCWNWREAGGAVAVLGLIANAYYGAAIAWRPAGFISGETGSGKSALLDVVRGCLPLHHYSNDTSKPGIEQAVNGRAMPIVIDEASDRADRVAARNLIDLVLSASGGEGTKGVRGTVDGKGRAIEVAGLIMMFSINPPELEPQHLGRFALVELKRPADGEDFRAQHMALAQMARDAAAGLWGRALAGFERYRGALEAFRGGLGAAGCAPRERDQAGALLAGWWVLTHEGLPDERGVREGIAALDGFVRVARDVATDSRPRRCLNWLLTAMVALHRSTDRDPIARLIEIALGDDTIRSPEDARDLLTNYGIRVVRRCVNAGRAPPPEGCGCVNCRDRINNRPVPRISDGAGIWLANGHPALARLFADSPFHGDKWRSELGRLEQARPSGRTVRVGRGTPGHALWLPVAELVGMSDDERPAEPDG